MQWRKPQRRERERERESKGKAKIEVKRDCIYIWVRKNINGKV